MQHERARSVPVVQGPYCVDTLGAPFKVILNNGVTLGIDQETGEETVTIQDTIGLINAVVRSRVCHPRKLSGEEIKFLRKAIGVRAKAIAEFLDMTPEHFSRCESDVKTMSVQSEKLFRMTAYVASFLENPAAIFVKNAPVTPTKPSEKSVKSAVELLRWFQSLKIEVVFNPADEIVFEFSRVRGCDDAHDEGNWAGFDNMAA
jgi:DNA-binding transcriptional regulator YiaG